MIQVLIKRLKLSKVYIYLMFKEMKWGQNTLLSNIRENCALTPFISIYLIELASAASICWLNRSLPKGIENCDASRIVCMSSLSN